MLIPLTMMGRVVVELSAGLLGVVLPYMLPLVIIFMTVVSPLWKLQCSFFRVQKYEVQKAIANSNNVIDVRGTRNGILSSRCRTNDGIEKLSLTVVATEELEREEGSGTFLTRSRGRAVGASPLARPSAKKRDRETENGRA